MFTGKIKLGEVALWNLFFKRGTIDGNSSTLQLLKKSPVGEKQFEDLTTAPLPSTMETART